MLRAVPSGRGGGGAGEAATREHCVGVRRRTHDDARIVKTREEFSNIFKLGERDGVHKN